MAVSTQANADMNLQQKLREDAQMRVDELEESLLEKEQEVQKLQILVTKLQGEVFQAVVAFELQLYFETEWPNRE